MLKFVIFCLLSFSPVFAAVSNTVFSLTLEKPFGYTWYDLEHTGADTTIDGKSISGMVRSELNFPVDPVRVTLGLASLRPMDPDTLDFLRTDIGIWFGISPAFTKMRDEDWIGTNVSGDVSKSQALIKISDTHSSINSLMFGGEMNREFTEIHFLGEPFALGMGVGGAYFTYGIYGLSGRQINPDSPSGWTEVSLPNSLKVGTYLTYSLQSLVSLRTEKPILGLQWETRFHPIIFAHSHDDHILRKKSILMDCWGTGAALEADLPLRKRDQNALRASRLVPYAKAELNRTWGKMKQTYYADSPDTPDDETGKSISDIKTTVNIWQIGIGAHLNFNL